MAFNISSYIINGHRFPFIATLSRPFFKYYLNNFTWGGILVCTYLYMSSQQLLADNYSLSNVLLLLSGFLTGLILITLLSLGYFINTNKDWTKLFGAEPKQKVRKTGKGGPVNAVLHKKVRADSFFNRDREWNVETYLSGMNKIALARSIDHYDTSMLQQVFKQNHFNAALFEIAAVVSVVLLSFGSDYAFFNIPAGASLMLMFTIFIMLTSAIHSWFRGWASAVLIALLIIFNYLSQFEAFNPPNRAYGMNYNVDKATYSTENIRQKITPEHYREDFFHTLKILENWRKKNLVNTLNNKEKPKIIFVNTTGGGMRSSLWTFYCMQYADSLLHGELLHHTQLITGSSGGMIGMSYLRELYYLYNQQKIPNLYDVRYAEDLAKDILNRVGFTLTVNDLLFKTRSFTDGDSKYKIDRGYAFEQQLNANTHQILDKRLKDYFEPEFNAEIPMAVISPTIVSDGRRLLISPQPISYLSYTRPEENIKNDVLQESVEFSRFFAEQDATNIRYTTALRMSSTFPYIMPIVQLPSEPTIEVMDSGLRDNFGTKTTLKFLYTFKNWIEANTSGVIILQIRDLPKETPAVSKEKNTIFKSIASPVGNIYKNLFITQDYEHDQLIQYASEWFDGTIDIIDFALENNDKNRLSLSWHLTDREKAQVYGSIHSANNQASLRKLQALMKEQ